MTTIVPYTVFCKDVFRIMGDYGYEAKKRVRAYVAKVPDSEIFAPDMWTSLKHDCADLLRGDVHTEPLRVLQFAADVTDAVKPLSVDSYRSLLMRLFSEADAVSLWSHVKYNTAFTHTFVFFMLTVGYRMQQRTSLSKTVAMLTDKPFVMHNYPDICKDELAIALLGPVWHSLYMKDNPSDADLIELILNQKPPIMGVAKLSGEVDLPSELDVGI